MNYQELFNFVLNSLYTIIEIGGRLSEPLPLLNISPLMIFTSSTLFIVLGFHIIRLVRG